MLLLAMLTLSRQAAGAISATTHPNVIAALESPVFVDTREADTCAGGSVEGALCMAPSQFLHPDGAPASFRDINWLAGAFGLEPARTAVVFGGGESDKDFVAGMLFLLGQSRVVIWQGDAEALLGSRTQGAGRLRGMLRSRFYTDPMRDEYIALDDDVRSFFGAGTVTRIEYPQSFEEAGRLPGSRRDTPLLYRHNDEGSLLLLARDTREAVVHLVRLLLRDPTAPARVHLDGLHGRPVESFGAPRAGLGRIPWLAAGLGAVAILCIAFMTRAMAGRRG